ncbi:chemotaxis response regulator protein-glutamate methylesterase [bacterium]|nr:MAG: chemotaxis response regulator protein-glutamate methylesterase [bacterium]RKZ27086.1 MAG: chemotaxis response regulator protein-glutamate methylesterase [bacterium]
MIRVLVVDDSAFMRKVIRDILEEDPEIEVVGTARNGIQAIKLVRELKPDVVTMDVEMPKMNGIEALEIIMKENPVPVIMVSAYTREGAGITIEALEKGAFDFVPKPGGPISLNMHRVKDILLEKVKAGALANIEPLFRKIKSKKIRKGEAKETRDKIVVIGTSTGGPRALSLVLPSIPEDFEAPILVVQHMPKGFTESFAKRLDEVCRLKVKEAEDGELIEPGKIIIAKGGKHMEVEEGRIKLKDTPPLHGVKPAVDPLFISAARHYGEKTVGVVLTGMGKDGKLGVEEIKRHGGKVIVQDRETSVVFGMPKAAISTGKVDEVLPLGRIAEGIVRMVRE